MENGGSKSLPMNKNIFIIVICISSFPLWGMKLGKREREQSRDMNKNIMLGMMACVGAHSLSGMEMGRKRIGVNPDFTYEQKSEQEQTDQGKQLVVVLKKVEGHPDFILAKSYCAAPSVPCCDVEGHCARSYGILKNLSTIQLDKKRSSQTVKKLLQKRREEKAKRRKFKQKGRGKSVDFNSANLRSYKMLISTMSLLKVSNTKTGDGLKVLARRLKLMNIGRQPEPSNNAT